MNEVHMQHGVDWTGEDLAGWIITEKLDGCRAYWDGDLLWTRGGIAANLPQSWKDQLPRVALDCELYDGTGGVYRCGAALKYGRFTPSMKLFVFEAPKHKGNWEERQQYARFLLLGSPIAECVDYRLCESTADALHELQRVQSRGGEGLMMRSPNIFYRAGRTRELLKVKSSEYGKGCAPCRK